jgi:hypothetical protein
LTPISGITTSPETAPPPALGRLAERLGLTGEVTAEHLLRLLDGRHPITGRRLIPYRKDRVAGVDQTLSAPNYREAGRPGRSPAITSEMRRRRSSSTSRCPPSGTGRW